MDLDKLMSTMLSGDSVSNMSKRTGTSQADVTSVLTTMLPALLGGAQGQASDAKTAAGFANALSAHAKADTSDLSAFLGGVDLEDGGKIIGHLLGGQQEAATQKAAQSAGIDVSQAGSIMAAAAPLLMSLMGQQTSKAAKPDMKTTAPDLSALEGLFGKTDLNDASKILSSLLGKK